MFRFFLHQIKKSTGSFMIGSNVLKKFSLTWIFVAGSVLWQTQKFQNPPKDQWGNFCSKKQLAKGSVQYLILSYENGP